MKPEVYHPKVRKSFFNQEYVVFSFSNRFQHGSNRNFVNSKLADHWLIVYLLSVLLMPRSIVNVTSGAFTH